VFKFQGGWLADLDYGPMASEAKCGWFVWARAVQDEVVVTVD
jgi:hypothetical protein